MTWGYDRYGNFLSQSATGNSSVSIGQPAYTSSGGNNRLDSFNYDSSGNLSVDAVGNQFTYDAAGKLAAVQGAFGYVYNAEGHRVAKLNSNGSVAGSYVLGLGGEQITEVDGSGNWVHTNVFANGKLIATYDNEGGNQLLHFHLSDWLGTRRAQTDQAGDLEQQCSSLPFGDNLQCGLSINIPTEHHFTGNERDSETGLDYFGARYYGSKMGRWMSPDWSESPDTVPYAALESPQSLNLYTYVQNNPILDTDPDGHEKCADGSAADACVNGGPKDPVSTIDLRLLGLIAQRTITVAVQNAVQSTAEYLTAPRDPGCMAAAMATGAATGAVGGGLVGGIAGGAGGTLVAPGIGTVVGGGVAGAIEGTKDGAMAGAAVGGIYGFVACKGGSGSGGGGGPKFGSNKQQNKNARDARRAAERETGKKFTPALERKFHDAISKQGIDNYHELVEIAVHVLKGY
jgi:RHS repeat-associated protein